MVVEEVGEGDKGVDTSDTKAQMLEILEKMLVRRPIYAALFNLSKRF